MFGIFLIDKPAGMTSHDVVDFLRRVTGEKRIGHAGTLDPLATGLMIVAVGREYTKQLDRFLKLDKTYIATATLGANSTTYDSEGGLKEISKEVPEKKTIEKLVVEMVGKQTQMPPIFSAKKIKGKKAYELARAGKEVNLEPKNIEIYEARLIKYEYPEVVFEVKVSSGTYIRTLVHELGEDLGVGAYMTSLTRTRVGEYTFADAVELKEKQA